jgi:ATP-dependent Clp protease ATP-binding subunit ClpA
MSEQICSICKKNPASEIITKIKSGRLIKENVCSQCAQGVGDATSGKPAPAKDKPTPKSDNSTPVKEHAVHKKAKFKSYLDDYGTSLTQKAAAGKMQKVIGREKEIEQVIQVLCRRHKCNPCLIGEPGVGKTVIAEWLAQRIINGDVPGKLRGKEIYELDVTSLMESTGLSGDLEARVKLILNDVESRGNVILFIDEIHRIIGAGVTIGNPSGGIDNMLKPYLARDGFSLISATTLSEYRIIEQDAAFERRFQPIIIEEPSIEETVEIMLGIKDIYEQRNDVKINEEVIRKTVTLADRYIMDRFFPDKAITLLDQASTNLYVLNEKARATSTLVIDELASKDIAKVIEGMTKIPVTDIDEDDTAHLLALEEKMKESIIGQDNAVETVCAAIKRKRVGTSRKQKPISFIFIGSSGVGKTEFAKRLNKELFGSGGKLVRLDMSEYMHDYQVSRIIGSSPGYIGYGNKGQLDAVRNNPFCVVLLDEIEKAHPDVMNIFLQVLDDGHLTSSVGKKIYFKHAIIIMTTNAGSTIKEKMVGFNRSADEASREQAEDALKKFLRPELINRVDEIVYFNHLTEDNIRDIARIVLDELCKSMAERENPIKLTYGDEMLNYLAKNGHSTEYGARNLRRFVQKEIEDKIANKILENKSTPITTMSLSLVDDEVKVLAVRNQII